VTPDSGTANPTGTVTFYLKFGNFEEPYSNSQTATIDPNTRMATLNFTTAEPVTDVQASYGGDDNFSASQSAEVHYDVPFATRVYSPFAFPNPAVAGQTIGVDVELGYAVQASVCEGATNLGTGYVSPDDPPGFANIDVWFTLPAGTHYITAGASCPTYPGESDVLTLIVLPAPTTVSDASTNGGADLKTTPAAAVKTADPPAAPADPTTTEPGPALAATGVSVGPPIAAAFTAFALGALLLLIGRRPERSTRGH
jgi:hypothetical protein